MNRRCYRLVFNQHRRMLMAVEESAAGMGKGRHGASRAERATANGGTHQVVARFGLPAVTLAAWLVWGLPVHVRAQVVADPNAGAHRPTVVQTANGLNQVNITRPSAAGVSTNAFTQFDVPRAGVILNNSPEIIATQQAGYINGNPNLLPGGSARIIVNQVTSALPSQLRGYLEVAGPRSEVIVANPNGILVDGAGFINTSRATLTTGVPMFGGSGSLDAYRVTGGQISIDGAGLNAANVDQVDLIARAVRTNAALYANQLNIVAGANRVERGTLATTRIEGVGGATALGIDVSQLGGMYANKILLASTELGVGVSNRGVVAAQAGELTLTTEGRLVLGGQTNAGGSLVARARDGIDNSGTTYGAGAVSMETGGALSNSGMLAARQGLAVNAGGVSSSGTLGAGVGSNGSVGTDGDLTIVSTGALSATGRNVAGGSVTLQGSALNLAGSQTAGNRNVNLTAAGGNLDLAGAATSAGGRIDVQAQGALINDRGRLSSGNAVTVTAGAVSNESGQILAQGPMIIRSNGATNNTQGALQSAGALTISTANSLDNAAGRIVSVNGDGLSIDAGTIVNAGGNTATGEEGGVIGSNGNVRLAAQSLGNHGRIEASGDASLVAGSLSNDSGSIAAGGELTADVTGSLTNRGGKLVAATATVLANALDNSAGRIEAAHVAIETKGHLANRGGVISQYGQGDTRVAAGGVLDNSGGTFATNGQNLTVTAGAVDNSGGKIEQAGTGALMLSSAGLVRNEQGTIQTNGSLLTQAGAIGNRTGTLYGQAGLVLRSNADIDNTGGDIQTAGDLTVSGSGTLSNANGMLAANGMHSAMAVSANCIDNSAGRLVNAGDGATAVTSNGDLGNNGGVLGGNGDTTIVAQSLANASGGKLTSAGALALEVARNLDNRGGTLYGQTRLRISSGRDLDNRGGNTQTAGDLSVAAGGALVNAAGTLVTNGSRSTMLVSADRLDNSGGKLTNAGDGATTLTVAGLLGNAAGVLGGNGDTSVAAQGLVNTSGASLVAGRTMTLDVDENVDNRGGSIYGQTGLSVSNGGVFDNTGGDVETNGKLVVAVGGALNNTDGTLAANGAHGAMAVSASSIDNSRGKLANAGDSTTTVTATGTLTNGRGVLGGNGDTTIAARELVNTDNGSVIAARDLKLEIKQSLNNRGGALFGQTGLTLSTGAGIDNAAGDIETSGDLAITALGAISNVGGTLAANGQHSAMTVSAAGIDNSGGKLVNAGDGATEVTSVGALTNTAGVLGGNGNTTVTANGLINTSGGSVVAGQGLALHVAQNVNNSGGTLYGQTGLVASSGAGFDNSHGDIQTTGDMTLSAGGALSNAGGTLSANGQHGAMSVSAASVDNNAGRVVNAGDGTTNVNTAGVISNYAGVLGGNGNTTIAAQDLVNTGGGNVTAGRDLALHVARTVDNRGGTVYGGTALSLSQASASLDNQGGTLLGGQDVIVKVASVGNAGGIVRANRDIGVEGAVGGSGEMTAGRNLTLAVTGDYLNDAANKLKADGELRLSSTGTLTNTGTLAAAGNLSVTGTNVVNGADAVLTGASTTVNAGNAIANAGRIDGDTVHTTSASLDNTGTIIGYTVQVQAGDILNNGPAAIIAAAQDLRLYAGNSVSNLDGATIYSAGNLQIGRDGTRDGSGMLANQTGSLLNRSATIEADGDVDIAARSVTNSRTSVVTEAGTPTSTTQTLKAWLAGLPDFELTGHQSITFPQWRWPGGAAKISAAMMQALRNPITIEVPKADVTNVDTANKTLSFTKAPIEEFYNRAPKICDDNNCQPWEEVLTRPLTTQSTQHYESIEDTGASYKITFWPDYDPARHIRPDQVRIRFDLGVDNHDYSEIERTTTTSVSTDRLVSATAAGIVRAQGAIRINSDGGAILNQSSTMAAGGDLVRRAIGGSVGDIGTALQQTTTTTDTSTFYWHQKSGGNSDTKVVPYPTIPVASTTVMALPAIASSNQSVQTTARDVSVTTVDRVGNTVTGSGVAGAGKTNGGVSGGNATAGSVTGGDTTAGGVTGGNMSGGNVSGGGAAGAQVGGVSGQAVRPQTVGTAQGGLPNLTLPTNGLFRIQPAPNATYLVATDPRFTQYKSFISSDYMLGELGLDPHKVQKRLGDGFYEEKLIRDQVTQLTGRTFLAGYSDQMEEYKSLMNNGVAYAKAFGLTPGIGLSDEQMQQLTTDMVWLVSQDVTLSDGTTQSVLVPKLYLAQANTVNLNDTGALVTGKTVSIDASGNADNSGRIVGDVATQVLGNNIVNRGTIGGAGSNTVVQAALDVLNKGGTITGKDVVVSAGRDVVNETHAITALRTLSNGYSAGGTGIGSVASISASGTTAVLAGRDINMSGGRVDAGENALLAAGRDLNIGTVALGTTQDAVSRGGQSYSHDQVVTNAGSTLHAGENLVAVAGRDATLSGSEIQAGGNASLLAGRDTTVTAVMDTHTHSEGSLGGKGAQYTQSSYDETARGSTVQAGGNATLAAGQSALASAMLQSNGISPILDTNNETSSGNLSVLGSSVTTGGESGGGGVAQLIATGDVTVGTVNETHHSDSWSESKKSGFLSKSKTTKESSQRDSIAVGSIVSADSVEGSAGRDMVINGSTVAATNDVTLNAGRDLSITSAESTSSSYNFEHTTKSGFGATGSGLSYGKRDQKDTINQSSVTQTGSLVGSTDGSVQMSAGNTLKVSGSELIAAKDISGIAADVTIEAAKGTRHHDETHEVKQSGFTLGVSGGAIGSAISAGQKINSASQSKDGRASALWGIAAARDVFDAGSVLPAGKNPTEGAAITLSWGKSHSKQTFTEDSTTHTGSSVTAGGNTTFVATGVDASGNRTAGNINIVGSDVSATNVALGAKNEVNIVSATDTAESHSTNKSSSGSIGISYGAQGFGVSASASKAKGNSDSVSTTQVNSHISGTDSVAIVSGGDTNILGGVVTGGKVAANVGGDLNLQSRQDTEEVHARQESKGGGFSISQGGGSASFSASKGKADGSYANVTEQTAIRAGDGGFDITVKGNTDLDGAVISSTATADKNSLTTGTLSWNDVRNHSDFSATSFGLSAGGAFGGPVGQSKSGPTSGKNTGGISPMIPQSDSGSQEGLAKAGVSAGTITITDTANQKQDVATLNRDTASTNSTVGKNPDLANVLSEQADMMAAAQAAGEAVARTVGDIANSKQKDAQLALKKAEQAYQEDPSDANRAAIAEAQAAVDGWKEGGQYRAALHSAGGALIAGIGGGSALAGAAGAGLSSLAAPKLAELGNTVAGSIGTGNADLNEALGNLAANIASGGLGAAVGGGTGAATGANVDRFNRQLHPSEYEFAKKNARVVAEKLGISIEEAEGRIVAEILRNSDKQTAEDTGGKHDYEVRSVIGCNNLNCDGYKNDKSYADHGYNSQYISLYEESYRYGQQQIGAGMSSAQLREKNLIYERFGKGALAITACAISGGTACQAAASGFGMGAATSYITNRPFTTAEAFGSALGGFVGAAYGANLNSWAGELGTWYEKLVLGGAKIAPVFAGKQTAIPIGNATALGGAVDPLFDPGTNPWWGLRNTIENIKEQNR
ncbi:filamentous hemagglutinin [Cupriavidus sp. HPC(L)]|uniref:two-partner secretion domain-containing protein n=1 Tax=Cupriavidus sp. HPC(L) TaxID=1217418 RepID=UPI0003BE007F|nr:hemagglutinin repeat-containing protein [Cupriavidus sp. HPC(L)]ESJ26718.1 filamentous hemagglutinin [Cupriavidus sp. HPC(L)]